MADGPQISEVANKKINKAIKAINAGEDNEMDLMDMHMGTIPDKVFTKPSAANFKELWISDNDLTSIPALCERLTGLRSLYLSCNNLGSPNAFPSTFSNLVSLTDLDLRQNNIVNVPAVIFALPAIRELSLRQNQIFELPGEAAGCASLRILDLSQNAMEKFPGAILGLQLEDLNVSKNPFDSLPDGLADMAPSLTDLNFSDTNVDVIPASVLALTNLKYLMFRNTQIREIPVEINNMTRLEDLDVQGLHRLVMFPAVLVEHPSIESLTICDCALLDFENGPVGICLGNLTSIDLRKNMLGELPEGLHMPMLETLLLDNNSLSDLPDTLSTLESTLDWLSLDGNNLERFPTVLLSLTKLTDLSIGGNPLEEIPMGISALTNLDSFNAKDCRLVTVPKALAELSIDTLQLQGNPLQFPPAAVLESDNAALIKQVILDGVCPAEFMGTGAELKIAAGLMEARNDDWGNFADCELDDSLPEELLTITGLTSIELDGNNFTHVPTDLFALSRLTYLSISRCKLGPDAFPDDFAARMPAITSLTFNKNPMRVFPDVILELPGLSDVDCCECELEFIPIKKLAKKDVYLDCSNNRLPIQPKSLVSMIVKDKATADNVLDLSLKHIAARCVIANKVGYEDCGNPDVVEFINTIRAAKALMDTA